jgi:hypothetical protein
MLATASFPGEKKEKKRKDFFFCIPNMTPNNTTLSLVNRKKIRPTNTIIIIEKKNVIYKLKT